MPVYQVEHVFAAQDALGEGPVWSVREQALYWVDIEGRRVHRLEPASGAHEVFAPGPQFTALGFRASGGLVAATGDGFALWDPRAGAVQFIANPEPGKPGARFNDGAVDRQGRFWAGTMTTDDASSSLYRLDADGSVHKMESGIGIANGIGWSLDERTMYFTDSVTRTIYAYDYDAATGEIENRRPFVHTPDEAGVPDGLAVDSEGCVWSARWGGYKLTRYDPTGQVEREVRLPVQFPTSCAFGGAGLDELYVTSAWVAVERRGEQPLAGDLFRLQVEVKGVEEAEFLG
jgi:sugar lactone lactonase YvrE